MPVYTSLAFFSVCPVKPVARYPVLGRGTYDAPMAIK